MSMSSQPYEEIIQLFKNKKCILLTKKENYVNSDTKVEYICPCGRKIIRSIQKFKLHTKNIEIAYCRYCSPHRLTMHEKRKQTCLERYGKTNYIGSEEQKQQFLKKYGVDSYSKTEECKNKTKQTFIEKYRVDSYLKTNDCRVKTKQTCLEKYGVEAYSQTLEYKEKLKKTLQTKYGVDNIGEFQTKGASKESQIFLVQVYQKLPENLLQKCFYASLKCGEYCMKYKGKYFKYDFVNSITKTCIEYNGFSFHPRADQLDEEIGWFAFDKNKTVKEAREYEKIKYQGLEERGYKILTVWDYEFKSNPIQLIDKCVQFIISGNLP